MARISPGTMTAAIFAILVGLAGAYAVRQYLHRPPVAAATAAPSPSDVLVPIAASDLMSGRTLTTNDIVLMRLSAAEYPKSPYANQPFMRDTRQIAGRMLREDVKKGTVFLTASFFPEGMEPGVAELLEPGYRAVTVPIEHIGAVEGFARPGSLVDVLFRSTPRDDVPELTMTLLERVEVLALGRTTLPGHRVEVGDNRSQLGTVTLAVTPAQAKALKVVEQRGVLSLARRNPDDELTFPVGTAHEKVTLEQLLDLPTQRGPKKMDVYLGSQKKTVTFDEDPTRMVDHQGYDLIRTPIAADPAPAQPPATSARPPVSPVQGTVVDVRPAGS